jgi:HlyD family secretion protein
MIVRLSKNIGLLLLAVALGAGAVAGAGYYWMRTRNDAQAAPAPNDRDRTRQPDSVAALGRIEPWGGIINLGASFPDQLESLSVDRGDWVKSGEVLGYLGGYNEQMAQRDVLLAQLDEAKSRLEAENAVNLLRVRSAELNRRRVFEVFPYRIAAQEANIASLEAKRATDKDIQPAREQLSELKHQFEIDKSDAAVQIDLAQATLDRAKSQFPIASLNKQIAVSEAHARRLTLYAPCNCQVLNVRVKAGEQVAGPILSLGDTSRMRAVAEVYETDIAQVQLGQTATITSRALSKPITGRVSRIGSMIYKNDILNVDPAARADARVVEVWIDLNDSNALQGLTNLTVDVVINGNRQAAR